MVRKPTPDKFIINTISPQFAGLRYWFAAQQPDGNLYELMRGQDGVWQGTDPADGWVVDGIRGGYVINGPVGTQGDYFESTNAPEIDSETDISISAWVKLNSLAANRTYFTKTSLGATPTAVELKWHSTNGWSVNFNDGATLGEGHTGTTGYAADTWYHIVVVYNGNGSTNDDKVKIYIDGVLDTALTFTGTIPTAFLATGGKIYIGATFNTSDIPIEHWDGLTDDIRIYGIVLSPGNVARMYDPSTRWELYRGPEVGFIGLATGITIHEPIPSGGILVGGEPTETMAFDPLTVGGAIVGGIATESVEGGDTFNEVGEGGILVGGEPTEFFAYNPSIVGGTLVGGEPTEFFAYNPSIVGGTLVGGLADVSSAEAKLPTGGVLVGGVVVEEFIPGTSFGGVLISGNAIIAIQPAVSGGMLAGGASNASFSEVGIGGALVGGEAIAQEIQEESVSGGAIVGGINAATIEFVVKGGAIVGGIASVADTQIESGSGGAIIGGIGSIGRIFTEETSGGVILGGLSLSGFSEIGHGGALVGGDINESVSITHDFTFTGDGIIIIDGTAGVRRVLRTPASAGPYVLPLTTGNSDIEECKTRTDCPDWTEHWQDKWQEPFDAIKESVDEPAEIAGLWENQWQENWLPEYVKWLTPHPGGAPEHSTAPQNDLESGHGPERILSQLPDAANYSDLSNPPTVNA